jgi:hypothetical protein
MTNRTVWKYPLSLDPVAVQFTQVKHIPAGARLVHCAVQDDLPTLWYEVDPDADTVTHRFQIFGTGHGPIGDHLSHIGTVLLADGQLVLHVYEAGAARHTDSDVVAQL